MAAPGHSAEYVEQVERARKGDLEAFTALVKGFQNMVVGAAFRWLGEIDLARDVAQEVFADAHRLLGQLDDPAAFPGWLSRITVKHCDRVTRRGRLVALSADSPSLDAQARDAQALETASTASPEESLEEREQSQRLRLAIEALPERDRLPLVLHYFAGEAQPDIARFLELPLSTVKQRLRTARRRLREQRSELMTTSLEALRPSRDGTFTSTVEFYIALRAGSHRRVAEMLDAHPELLEAEQRWEPELVRDGVLPFASRATPLITAVERGDTEMVSLLLARGALPDGPCGCPTGESALWAAVLLGRTDLARLLLESGADPNRTASTGNAPLHVAAMRGHREIVELLLAHGGDPGGTDRSGRTAAQWAAAKGYTAIEDLLEGLLEGRDTAEPEAARRKEPPATAVLETGIKGLDLFAPLELGCLVRVPLKAGVGVVVLLTELSHRFAVRPGRAVLWTGFAQGPFDPQDLRTELSEAGIDEHVEVFLAQASEAPVARRAEYERGLARAEALAGDEGLDVLMVILEDTGYETDLEASLPRLARLGRGDSGGNSGGNSDGDSSGSGDGNGSLTAVVITCFPESQSDVWDVLRPPYDAQINLDRKRATRALFPAIDPARTLSRAFERHTVGERHTQLAERAKALLAAYAALDPDFALPDPTTLGKGDTPERAQRLIRYLTQPFLTTEPFHGRLGSEISQSGMLDRVARILDGEPVEPGDDELHRPSRHR